MNEEWQVIECRGYKAYAEVDFNSIMINCHVYNISWASTGIKFSSERISGLYVEFERALDEYYSDCRKRGVEPSQPIPDQPPPLVFERYTRFLPELEKFSSSDLIMALRLMNNTLETMRLIGFLDVVDMERPGRCNQEDIYDALKFILSLTDVFLPKGARVWWLAKRLADDVEMIVNGHEPVFLCVDPYKGTKSSNPKHAAVRIECACAVAALMRRGMTRDDACDAIQHRLTKEGISTHKSGKAISARTVQLYYDSVRRPAVESGPVNYEEDPVWPAVASHKDFYVHRSLVPSEERFRIEADQECDLHLKVGPGINRDYPQYNGLSPLDNLIENLKIITTIS